MSLTPISDSKCMRKMYLTGYARGWRLTPEPSPGIAFGRNELPQLRFYSVYAAVDTEIPKPKALSHVDNGKVYVYLYI